MRQIISVEKEIPFKTMIGEITSISLEHTLSFQDDSSILGDLIVSGTYKLTEASRLDEDFSYKIPVEILLTETLEEEDRKIDIEDFTYEILDEEALLVKVDLAVEGREKIELEKEEVFEQIEEKEQEQVQEERNEEQKMKDDFQEIEVLEETENEREVLKKELDQDFIREEVLETTQEETTLKEETVMDAKENIDKISEETQMQVGDINEDEKKTSKEVMHSIFSVFKDADETFSTYSVYILREEDTLDDVLNRYNVSREEAALYNNLEELRVGSKLILPTVIENE